MGSGVLNSGPHDNMESAVPIQLSPQSGAPFCFYCVPPCLHLVKLCDTKTSKRTFQLPASACCHSILGPNCSHWVYLDSFLLWHLHHGHLFLTFSCLDAKRAQGRVQLPRLWSCANGECWKSMSILWLLWDFPVGCAFMPCPRRRKVLPGAFVRCRSRARLVFLLGSQGRHTECSAF